jgi:dephospho-CoA kinase
VTVLIGLTGPIACGKSTVARWLGERPGVVVIDADQVAREVVEPGQPALVAIVARFGEGIVRRDGTLDRDALGRIVFSDPDALRDLEAITHPAVRPRILAAIDSAQADGAKAVVIEAIRLVEGGLADICDDVWLVTCDPEIQRERLIGRGATREVADQRIDAQAGLAGRIRPVVTREIDTSGDAATTRALVLGVLDTMVRRVDGGS